MTPTPQDPTLVQETVNPESITPPASDGDRVVISGMSGLYPDSKSVLGLDDILYNKASSLFRGHLENKVKLASRKLGVLNRAKRYFTPAHIKKNPISHEALRYQYNHPEVSQYTGTVPGVSKFDAQFFKVHYRLGNCMDPMGRKILEQSYQAIYDAGFNPTHFSGKKVGVYFGTCFSEAEKACFYQSQSRSGFGIAGCSKTMFANRVSYWLNAKGPSMSIDQACCSSTVALEQAYLAIKRGECEAAIVGGAYLCLHPQSSVHYSRTMKLCKDGKTKSFDENADGCAKSEAINVLFLQKAKDAIRIYADVLHVKTEFMGLLPEETGPKYGFNRDVDKSTNFIKKFYEEVGVPTQDIEYIEAYGCAIPEADKVELQAIENVLCKDRNDPLLVGSVMSNIGYNEAAYGITAITKVLLGYHHGEIAANLHISKPRQDVLALREGRMRVVDEHQRFRRTYVAVNGMSVTGVNSHVLLNGHYKPKDLDRYKSNIPYLVTISARHDSAVTSVINILKSNPIDPEQLRLLHNIHQGKIAGHLGRGFIILEANEDKKTVSLCERAEYFDDSRRPLWFVYSGMGSQWAGMGAQLMRIPIFAAAIERCHQALKPKGLNIMDIITSSDEKTFDNILHSFVGIAAIQIGLTDILRELGLVPDGIIGHSVGELGCAYADGCLTAEEMILSAYSRGLVSLQTPLIRGSMAAVGLGYEQISKLCPSVIEVACHNGPESSTISGPADVMKEFVAELTAKGIFAKEVPCSNIAYHSRYIADAGPQLLKYLSEVIKTPKPRSERWLSTSVPQERWNEPLAKLCSAEYHTNNLLSPVLFEETSVLLPSNAVLVEVAPHGLLQAILKRSMPNTSTNIALTRRKHPDNAYLVLEGIGKLFMEGYSPKVHVLYPKVELPVSTGTPFLSHMVEWAHSVNWPLPLYHSADRKVAAKCNYVISVHDKDSNFLEGHTIRGKNLYPFAATLVLIWDTLAMSLGVPKKELSIEFTDLFLHAQPILHDQRQLRINVSFHRGAGTFEVLNENTLVATGTAKALYLIKDKAITETETKVSVDLTAEDIYHLLRDRDYSYSGEFRSIEAANASLSEATLVWNNNWVTLIDGLLQLNVLRQPHTAVSVPTNIRRLCINVKEHKKATESVASDSKVLIKAQVLEKYDFTRCGGITMYNIKWENLPPMINRNMALKASKFVSHVQSDIDMSSSLEVYLQIVAENVNKANLNVVGIVNEPASGLIFNELNNAINNVFGVNVKYEQVSRESALKKQNILVGADLVLVQKLSNDDNLCQLLHRVLRKDQFVVSEEDLAFGGHSRPSSLYRVLSVHTILRDGSKSQSQLQLARWGALAPVATTTVTVRSQDDIPFLTSTRNNLSAGHRLLIIAPFPSLPGLKDLISGWRRETNRNKINLIMVAKDSNDNLLFNEMPDIELAFNVLNNGSWGGEYYLPVRESASVSKNVTLQIGQIKDYDSLTWIEAPEISGPGLTVKVQYAGINNDDIKKANGSLSYKQDIKHAYGMEFSGTTDSGTRVMGLVESGAASSVVRARPELVWPVPAHWSLEDAATVPLAYVYAFYCLKIKSNRELEPGTRVLVHGGAGAFGQAVIAIALGHGCEVFATVSDMRKKHFLRKLFPELKDDHIGCSRNHSFADMVLSVTNGKGCNLIISSVGEDLKNVTINCTAQHGVFIDISQLQNKDNFSYGMFNLTKGRNYVTIDFSAIYKAEHIQEAKELQHLLSEGISVGYVRPLSRVTYAPHDAARAFRLLAASRHRGRVLLRMQEHATHVQPRLTFNASGINVIICNDDETLGLQLADKLVERGAKKLCVHLKNQSMAYLQIKIRSWQKSGAEVVVFSDKLSEEKDVIALLNNAVRFGPLEGLYVIVGDNQQDIDESLLSTLDLVSRKVAPDLKYFGVLNGDHTIGKNVCLRRANDQLPATMLTVPDLSRAPADGVCYRGAVYIAESALRGPDAVVLAHTAHAQHTSLLQKIGTLADIVLQKNTYKGTTTLEELGVPSDRIKLIAHFLKFDYNLAFKDKEIPLLTVDAIQQLEDATTNSGFKDIKSLSTFFSYVDADELLATSEMIFLPTLINSASMRDDEFDTSQTHLCILPGMEGHHERFRMLCERLKLPALVLQPGLDRPNETVQETAKRFAEVALNKTGMKENFYLLGYESGFYLALEMAAILEDHGLTGTVFCIGHAPDEFKVVLEEQISEFQTEEELQDGVVRHMYTLMTGSDTTGFENTLRDASTWSQKLDASVRSLLGRVPHSVQYTRSLIESALARIRHARSYEPRLRALRSQLVLLRAATQNTWSPLALQKHSQRPIAVHQLHAPLAHAPKDLRCAAIINEYLDPTILEDFNKNNLCDTYLLNPNSYMSSSSSSA